MKQCGGDASGTAVCTGGAAATAQPEQADRSWGWVAAGAAVAVAAGGVAAALVMLRSLLTGVGKQCDKTEREEDLESGRRPYTTIEWHAGFAAETIVGTQVC